MNREDALVEIERLIVSKHKEINIKNGIPIPEYYYIGIGKTASKSIFLGLDKTTVHWHRVRYFERIYQTDLLSRFKLNLFDVILHLSAKYKFKPFIIECYRDPVAFSISKTVQRIKAGKIVLPAKDKDKIEFIIKAIEIETPTPQALQWKKYFGVDLLKEFNAHKKYLFKTTPNANLMFLRFEDIQQRRGIFGRHGYSYIDLHENKSTAVLGDRYAEVLQQFKLPEMELMELYNKKEIMALYTEAEIEGFIHKWKREK